jgi:predicted DNA-binding ribbon-helix-helix protein
MVVDGSPYHGRERRAEPAVSERVTRLEEQFTAFQVEMRSQVKRNDDLHRDMYRLIEKLDERIDLEREARLNLASDLRTVVRDVASEVRVLATKVALVGGVLIIAANIVGPIVAPIIVRSIP